MEKVVDNGLVDIAYGAAGATQPAIKMLGRLYVGVNRRRRVPAFDETGDKIIKCSAQLAASQSVQNAL